MRLPFMLQQAAARAAVHVASAATGVQIAAIASFAIGAVYLVDCRMNGNKAEISECYLTALPMMGLSAGYQIGYATYNPNIKRPEDK